MVNILFLCGKRDNRKILNFFDTSNLVGSCGEESCPFSLGCSKVREGDCRRQILKYFFASNQSFPLECVILTNLY